jgi:hypothetical protein
MWPVIYRTSMPPTETSTGHRPPSNLPPGPPRSALPPLVVPQCPLSRAANADRSDRQHAQGKQPPCGAAIANGTFSPPGFRLRLGHKDARLLSEAASARNVPMLSGNLIMDASPPR